MSSAIVEKIDHLRCISLETVLRVLGATYNHASRKWHTIEGTISITAQKFMNWSTGMGGGGAIDLTMQVLGLDFKAAVLWLSQNISLKGSMIADTSEALPQKQLSLPQRDDGKKERIISYLHHKRNIPLSLIQRAIMQGKLYADVNANAVFLIFGKNKAIVGAELRGTSHKWRGMAPGSLKSAGCFYINTKGARKVVLCESAIDALSYFALDCRCWAVSTAGAHHNPIWIKKFMDNGYEIICAFDADQKGDDTAKMMIDLYPMVKRVRPYENDWNDVLLKSSFSQLQERRKAFFSQVAQNEVKNQKWCI